MFNSISPGGLLTKKKGKKELVKVTPATIKQTYDYYV
jgi:hypothetical protein